MKSFWNGKIFLLEIMKFFHDMIKIFMLRIMTIFHQGRVSMMCGAARDFLVIKIEKMD